MTLRTKQALQAAVAFSFVHLVLLSIGFVFAAKQPLPPGAFLIITLVLVCKFIAAFMIWWSIFRSVQVRIWHASYVGVLIAVLSDLLVLLVMGLVGLVIGSPAGVAFAAFTVWAFLPPYAVLLQIVTSSIRAMMIAFLVRWWQLRRVSSVAAE